MPLKRDQSATRLEESASNWPFIKKPPQVDPGPEISRKTSQVHYIYCAADELHAPRLTPPNSGGAGCTQEPDLHQGISKRP